LHLNRKAGRRLIVRKTLMLTLVLLISAVWLQAQDAGQTMGKTSDLTTIQGCLQFSGGHYRITDSTGTVEQLSGQANKLKAHIGHTVEITGKPGTKTVGTTVQGAASTAKQLPVFHVTSVKHIADTCTTK
jgi:hypothetical protein